MGFMSQPLCCAVMMANIAIIISLAVICCSILSSHAKPTMNLGALWFNKLQGQHQANQMTPENWEDLMVEWQDTLRNGALASRPLAGSRRHERGVLEQYEGLLPVEAARMAAGELPSTPQVEPLRLPHGSPRVDNQDPFVQGIKRR